MKLLFLCVASTVISYNTEIDPAYVDNHSAIACRTFPIQQHKLYRFVMIPELVDKVCNHFCAHFSISINLL